MRLPAVAVLLVVLATGCGGADPQTAPPETTTTSAESPTPGAKREAAPAIAGESLDGDAITLGDFRGRPVLINVWSSW